MAKITIGEKIQKDKHFDLSYTFTLDVPQVSITKEGANPTKDVTGVTPYDDSTPIEVIQADLEKRFNEAQNALNSDTKLSLYGMSYDGTKWTA